MILGRPTNLILGAFTALFNLLVLVSGQVGVIISAEIVAAVNIAAASVITLIANQPPTVNQGDKVNVITPPDQENKQVTV